MRAAARSANRGGCSSGSGCAAPPGGPSCPASWSPAPGCPPPSGCCRAPGCATPPSDPPPPAFARAARALSVAPDASAHGDAEPRLPAAAAPRPSPLERRGRRRRARRRPWSAVRVLSQFKKNAAPARGTPMAPALCKRGRWGCAGERVAIVQVWSLLIGLVNPLTGSAYWTSQSPLSVDALTPRVYPDDVGATATTYHFSVFARRMRFSGTHSSQT